MSPVWWEGGESSVVEGGCESSVVGGVSVQCGGRGVSPVWWEEGCESSVVGGGCESNTGPPSPPHPPLPCPVSPSPTDVCLGAVELLTTCD